MSLSMLRPLKHLRNISAVKAESDPWQTAFRSLRHEATMLMGSYWASLLPSCSRKLAIVKQWFEVAVECPAFQFHWQWRRLSIITGLDYWIALLEWTTHLFWTKNHLYGLQQDCLPTHSLNGSLLAWPISWVDSSVPAWEEWSCSLLIGTTVMCSWVSVVLVNYNFN